MTALHDNGTWELVSLLLGQSLVYGSWVFMIKYLPDGIGECYKVGLVAKRFTQTYGVDYAETSRLLRLLRLLLFVSLFPLPLVLGDIYFSWM